MLVREWAALLGLSERTLWGRVYAGWPVERILGEHVNTRPGRSKLSAEQVGEILATPRGTGTSTDSVARQYGVSPATIRRIWRGATYGSVGQARQTSTARLHSK